VLVYAIDEFLHVYHLESQIDAAIAELQTPVANLGEFSISPRFLGIFSFLYLTLTLTLLLCRVISKSKCICVFA